MPSYFYLFLFIHSSKKYTHISLTVCSWCFSPCVCAGGGDGAVLHLVSGNAKGTRLRRLLLSKVSCQTGVWTGEETRGRLRCVLQDREVSSRPSLFYSSSNIFIVWRYKLSDVGSMTDVACKTKKKKGKWYLRFLVFISLWMFPQVYDGPETHCGVQPGGHGQLWGVRGHAEQSDDQRQHRGGRSARGQQGHVLRR